MSSSSYSAERHDFCYNNDCQYIFNGEYGIECTCISNILIYFNAVIVLCWNDWIDPTELIKLTRETNITNDTNINCSFPENVHEWSKDESGELKHSEYQCIDDNKSATDDLLNDVPELETIEFIGCPTSANNTFDRLKKERLNWQTKTDYISVMFKYMRKEGLQLSERDKNLPNHLISNFKNIQNLAVYHNKFSWKDNFRNLKKLKMLFLLYNSLQILNSSTFEDLIDLERIYLENNGISKITENTFSKNRKLKEVDISNNKLSQLPLGLFSNLSELEMVDLSNNYLKNLPSHLFTNSPKVNKLYLNNNVFTNISVNVFEYLKELKTLQLDNNQILDIPEEMFEYLTSLEELYLDNNNISKLHTFRFAVPCNVRGIYLSNNKLQYLSNEPFFNCITVQNNLSTLNISRFSRMHDLIIDVSNNEIERFELLHYRSGVHQIKSIRFSLSYNNITEISMKEIERAVKKNQTVTGQTIDLDFVNNFFSCDCRIEDLVRYLDGSMGTQITKFLRITTINNVKCNYPQSLVGRSVKELKITSLPCPAEIFGIDCPEICECNVNTKNISVVYNCSHRNISRAPKISVSTKYNKEVEIRLEGNNLVEAPTKEMGYNNVTKLILSKNKIEMITWLPDNIKMLFIDHNNISFLSEETIRQLNSSNVTSISLDNNPWKCNCAIASFKVFFDVKFHFIQNYMNITCAESERPLVNEEINNLCPNYFILILPYIATLFALWFLISIIIALYYRYQLEIKTWLFAHNFTLWFTNEDESDEEKLYDAFISYSYKDEEFVTKELLPILEMNGPRPYKFCLHYRDWIPGEFIANQIILSVKNSRRTVIILTKNFLESVWGKMEFRTAHTQAMSEGRIRVIIILYGDVNLDEVDDELKAYLKTNTYLKWNDPWFWNKLHYALRHNNRQFQNTTIRTTAC